jgi:hypothetical protein
VYLSLRLPYLTLLSSSHPHLSSWLSTQHNLPDLERRSYTLDISRCISRSLSELRAAILQLYTSYSRRNNWNSQVDPSLSNENTLANMDGMEGLYKPLSLTDRRASIVNYNDDSGSTSPTRGTLTLDTNSCKPIRVDKIIQTRPRGPPTPNMTTPAELESPTHSSHDPPPPPTPAASPGPDAMMRPDWSDATDQEDIFLAQVRQYFKQRSGPERTRILGDLLNLCTSQQLSFVSQYVSPLLKKDPFTTLPDELCLRVCNPNSAPTTLLTLDARFSPLLMTVKYLLVLRRSREDGGTSSVTI